MSRVIIFAGPTLSPEHIKTLLPASEVHPPVAAGDLVRFAPSRGDLVVIIDGFFYQSASVRHKELLDLLRSGIHVWGAASMGALRAAELAPFGMRGFGQIFEAYRCGEIEGDDEVTILHTPEDMEYTPLTEALVNIRYACRCAVEADILSRSAGQIIVEVAAALPFYERTYQNILKHVAEEDLSSQEAEAFQTFLKQEKPNLKQRDALELLQAIPTRSLEPLEPSFEWHETALVQSWRTNEKGAYIAGDHWVWDNDALTAYQLLSKDYPAWHYSLLLELLADLAADSLKSAAPLRDDARVDSAAHYVALRCNLSLEEELPESMRKWLYPAERDLSRQEQLVKIAIRLWFDPRGIDWRAAVIQRMKTEGIFQHWQKLVVTAHTLNTDIWGQDAIARCYTLREEVVSEWFRQRWGILEKDFAFALLDRGFSNTSDFFNRACFFYLFDKHIGIEYLQKQLVES